MYKTYPGYAPELTAACQLSEFGSDGLWSLKGFSE